MKLRKVEIKNFRGIKDLSLNINETTVLIGENNIGKTAVLDALRFALRDIRSRRGCAFDTYDFHLSDSSTEPADAPPISIRLTFHEEAPGEWENDLIARLNRSRIAQIDSNGCTCVILKVGARYDVNLQDFVQEWEFQNPGGNSLTGVPDNALLSLQNEVSYYYLTALRDAAKHFDARGAFWRPFLKESQLTPEKRAEIEAKLAEVNDLIISSHGSFTQVVEKLKDVEKVVSMSVGGDTVSVDAVPGRLFDMLTKAQVTLNTLTGAKVPVGRHGEGTQSLAVLMLFSAFLESWNRGAPILAMEEPEAHLHPSAVRSLWRLIEQMPGQKIISTHSGDLLSEVPKEAITRLYMKENMVVASRLRDVALAPDASRQFNAHIRRARGELLFARCWILGEGETEATLIPETARLLDIDLEQAGIRVVTYQTGISLEPCLEVAEGMGIKWVVLADNDQQGAKDHEKVRERLNGRPEKDALFIMEEENIEQYLCVNGFTDTYCSFLSEQTWKKVTSPAGTKEYALEVAKALRSKYKTRAAHEICSKMREDVSQIPELFKELIESAIKLARES